MIVFNVYWLEAIGMPHAVVEALVETRGLMFTALDTFGSGLTGGRFSSALFRETAPRMLVLVGTSDRHGVASGWGSVIEIGIDGHNLRGLTTTERDVLLEHLAMIDHPTSRAIAAAISGTPAVPQ